MYSGIDASFVIKLLVLLAVTVIFIFLFQTLLRKWLNVEKPKWFSYQHVNEKHKKVDWITRGITVVLTIIWLIITLTMENGLLFGPSFPFLLVIFIPGVVQVIMEWKYAENRNAYLATAGELVFFALLFTVLISTEFFGWFG
ncbi:DUF4181 domain-containing protein [Halalkalibacter oceani]|uniref:DUF4181 domain-containing protein n=1 Tax=Halalkalibacter oceani TaxID=1653776 RepID=UPI00339800CE